jgi:hypothetical protein
LRPIAMAGEGRSVKRLDAGSGVEGGFAAAAQCGRVALSIRLGKIRQGRSKVGELHFRFAFC